jgi:hypothetical protein
MTKRIHKSEFVMIEYCEIAEPGKRHAPSKKRSMMACASGAQLWPYHVPLSSGQKYYLPRT